MDVMANPGALHYLLAAALAGCAFAPTVLAQSGTVVDIAAVLIPPNPLLPAFSTNSEPGTFAREIPDPNPEPPLLQTLDRVQQN